MSESPLDKVLSHLQNIKKTSSGYTAKCPSHDDRINSLSISRADDGRVLMHCHAGCETEDIVTALGLKMKDLWGNNNYMKKEKAKIIETYDYEDEDGKPFHRVCKTNKKNYWQFQLNEKNEWIPNIKGVKRVPYHLPELLEAIKNETDVFITEGEKDVDNLRKLGLCATCNSGGAGKWLKMYNKYFKNAHVIILPDNDPPGKHHAEIIAENLYGIANDVRILELPELPLKGDVTDYLNNGGTKENLMELIKIIPVYKPPPPVYQLEEDESSIKFKLSDLGNKERMIHLFRHAIRHNGKLNKWFVWNGKYWETDAIKKVYDYAEQTFLNIYEEASKIKDKGTRKKLANWAKSCETLVKKEALVKSVTMALPLDIKLEDLDKDHYLFNTLNCTINLECGPLPYNHRSDDYITRIARVYYNPSATCPKWNKFLDEIFDGNEELITYIKRAVGYTLTGDVSQQCFFFLYGTGKNGKTVFLETLKLLFGEYSCVSPAEMLLWSRHDRIPSDVAMLKGKRLAISNEMEENRYFAESKVKLITGGDTITARKMHKDWFEFKPTHKLWISGNNEPEIKTTDPAMKRRLKKIPFNVKISDEQEIPMKELLKGFEGELSGILNWAIQGCVEFQERGLSEPSEVREATEEYFKRMDIIGQFIGECCVVGPCEEYNAKNLWYKYKRWCEENNVKIVLNNLKFLNKMKKRECISTFNNTEDNNKVWYRGVSFKIP